jgi:hypothetical protein
MNYSSKYIVLAVLLAVCGINQLCAGKPGFKGGLEDGSEKFLEDLIPEDFGQALRDGCARGSEAVAHVLSEPRFYMAALGLLVLTHADLLSICPEDIPDYVRSVVRPNQTWDISGMTSFDFALEASARIKALAYGNPAGYLALKNFCECPANKNLVFYLFSQTFEHAVQWCSVLAGM